MNKEVKNKKSTEGKSSKVSKSTVPVETINVNFEDEITFVIDRLESSKEKRVLVSIPSGSDLLVSNVSLELLAEAADQKNKKIVIVTDDESGRALARSVGLTVRGSVAVVDDMAWKEADIASENRDEDAKQRREKVKDIDESELVPIANDYQMDDSPAPVLPVKHVGTETVEPVLSVEPDMKDQISPTKKVQVGDFEMTVDSSPVNKVSAMSDMESQIKPEVLRPSAKSVGKGGFVGRDFSKFEIQGMSTEEKNIMKEDILPVSELKKSDGPKIVGMGEKTSKKFDFPFLKKIFVGGNKKKIIIFGLLGLLLLSATGTFAASRYLPEVIVTLEVDSIAVDYSGEIKADLKEDDINEDDLVIPAKTEQVEKNGSDSASTTGVEYKGEKATGSVLIYNKNITEEVVLNAGTVITNGGLNFVTQTSVVLDPVSLTEPATMGEADIAAQKIGDQYNLIAGTQFAVSGFNLGDVYAVNVDAFAGGTEEELRVVAQADIDGIVEKVKENLDKEALTELEDKTDDSKWILVEDSVEHELKGDPKASAAAGAEASTVDVSIETVSKALYYDGEKMEELIKKLLLKDHEDQIEDFEVSDNMEKTISVKSYDLEEGTITFDVDVSGFIMPLLNDDNIRDSLMGLSWTEGIKYLEDMDYVSEKYDLEYFPEWMPEALWRMPVSKNRITVKVRNVIPEDTSDSENQDSEESE